MSGLRSGADIVHMRDRDLAAHQARVLRQ